MKWLVHRSLEAASLLLAVSFVSFLMGRMAPGRIFDDLELNPQIGPETIAKLRARYGAGDSVVGHYARWLTSAARGDFGTSISYQRPVAGILWPRAMATLKLTAGSCALAWLVALPWAMLSVLWPRGAADRAGAGVSALFLAIPELLLALISILAAVRAGAPGLINSFLLPAGILVAGAFPVLFGHARAAFDEADRSSYAIAARAHGVSGVRLWTFYTLPLAANPLISLLGSSIGALVGASLIVETVFSRPGLGPLFLEAIAARDLDVVTGVLLLSALFLVLGNLFADVLLAICDPRIRPGGA